MPALFDTPAPPANSHLALDVIQRLANDLASTRRTPFGAPIPSSAVAVTQFGFSVAPIAYGTQVQLIQYQIKVNWSALFAGLVLGWVSQAGPAPLPGDITFTADVDVPLGVLGVGYTEKNFGAVQFPLGSFTQGLLWPIEWKHSTAETVRIKATPNANVPLGAGSFLVAALVGWEWPSLNVGEIA